MMDISNERKKIITTDSFSWLMLDLIPYVIKHGKLFFYKYAT